VDPTVISALISLGPAGILALVLFYIHMDHVKRTTIQQDKDRELYREDQKQSDAACERRHVETMELIRSEHNQNEESHRLSRHAINNLANASHMRSALSEDFKSKFKKET
jgi:hypothetical protein